MPKKDILSRDDVYVAETKNDVEIIETIDVIEVEHIEPYNVLTDVAFPAVGEPNEALKHQLLNGRELDDQHPISAITGLRNELDDIERLKVVYSDKTNIANYYEWENGQSYDTYGYFVSLVPNTSTIKMCDGGDILGVSVETAGFIGGQDESIPRSDSYGLITTSGLVDVRCELDVEVGDYVISNHNGYATKSNNGYKVLARENKNGVEYAVIMLGVQADVINTFDVELGEIEKRVDVNETNIVSAINVANQAYNKATEIDAANQLMSDKVDNALGIVDKVTSDVENMGTQISNSSLISAQAKAIAESAATSAESAKIEAIAEANKALAEITDLRKEFEAKVVEIDAELDNTVLELEETKEGIETTRNELQTNIDSISSELDNTRTDLNNTRNELLEDVDEVSKDINTTKFELNTVKSNIEALEDEIEPLATWTDGTNTGTVGFVAKANKDSATLANIVTWQGETNKSIAGFKQEAADTYATIESVSSLETETSETIAGIKQEASEKYATIESVASLETNMSNAMAEVKQEVSETYATIESVASLETDTSKSIASFKQEVQNNYATQEMLTEVNDSLASFRQDVEDDYATQEMVTAVDSSLASYKQEVSEAYATQEMVTEVDDALTSYKQEVKENYATQQMVTSVKNNLALFEQKVEDDYATQEMVSEVDNALTAYKQEVKNNYATQQMLSTVENNFTSFQQEVTDNYATQQMVTAVDNNLSSYKQEVTDTYATQEMVSEVDNALTSFKQDVQKDYATQSMVTQVDNALTNYKQEATKTYATNESLTSLRTDTTNAIAASENKATATYASKSDLTSFEGKTNTTMARIEQKADANGAYIQSTVSNMDKYAVGPYSQSYGFTLDQAKSVIEKGMIYVPTVTHPEEEPFNRTFTQTYYCTWDGEKWVSSDAPAVTFSNTYHIGTDSNPYWYVESDNDIVENGITYRAHTLYKWESNQWVAIATLEGNSQSRAVSQIRQAANSIEFDVTDVKGDLTGIKIWAGDDFAAIQDTVNWTSNNGKSLVTFMQEAGDNFASASQVAKIVDKDGNIIESSIVTAVNNNASSISLSADSIEFTGQKLNIKVDATNIDGALVIGQLPTTVAEKSDVATAKSEAITAASNDATTKANNAKSGAVNEVKGFGYQTASDVNGIVDSKGYQTETGVVSIIDGRITADYVEALEIKVKAAQIDGTLTADKVDVTGVLTAGRTEIDEIISQKITADYVNAMSISADSIIIKNTSGSTLFSAGSNKVSIGGWTVDSNSLYHGNTFSTSDTFLCSTGSVAGFKIGDRTEAVSELVLKAGNNFGVTNTGRLYCSNADISGKITSTDGKIGGWTINETGLWHGNNIEEADIILQPAGESYTYSVAGMMRNDWRLKVGSGFAVDSTGVLYSTEGYFRHSTKDVRYVNLSQGRIQIKPKSDTSGNYTRYPLLEFYDDNNTLHTLVARKLGNTWDLMVISDKTADDFLVTI